MVSRWLIGQFGPCRLVDRLVACSVASLVQVRVVMVSTWLVWQFGQCRLVDDHQVGCLLLSVLDAGENVDGVGQCRLVDHHQVGGLLVSVPDAGDGVHMDDLTVWSVQVGWSSPGWWLIGNLYASLLYAALYERNTDFWDFACSSSCPASQLALFEAKFMYGTLLISLSNKLFQVSHGSRLYWRLIAWFDFVTCTFCG